MAQTPNYYSDGLVSLDQSSPPGNLRTIKGHGTTWMNKIYGGDILMVIGQDESSPSQSIAMMAPIEAVTESEELVLAIDWPGPAFEEQPYIILYTSPQRYDYLTLATDVAFAEEHLNLFNKAVPIFSVKTYNLDAPTGAEILGDLVVVSASPDPFSVFGDRPHCLAEKTGNGWIFHEPEHGWFHVSEDDHVARFFNGAAWVVSGALVNAPIYIPGGWQAADTYALGNVVTHLGKSWIAKRETVGDAPNLSPSDWEVYTGLGEHGGAITLRYKFSANTSMAAADTAGVLNLNSTPALATALGMNVVDIFGNNRAALLESLLTISNSDIIGTLRLVAVGDSTKDFSARVIAGDAVNSPATHYEFELDKPIPTGAFVDTQDILFMFTPTGERGDTGDVGAEGIAGPPTGTPLLFDPLTADADPGGPGKFRFNTATQNVATAVRVDNLNAEGVAIDSFLDAMELLTTSTIKFIAMFLHRENPQSKYIAFGVTDVVGAVGYRNLVGTVIGYSSPNPFVATDEVLMQLFPAGTQGDAATIEVGTVNPLAHTDPPTVVNSGTPQEAVFDFGIPAGAPFTPNYVVPTIDKLAGYGDKPVMTAVLVEEDSTNGNKPTLYFLLTPSEASPSTAVWSGGIDFTPTTESGAGGVSGGEEPETAIAASSITDIGAVETTRVAVTGTGTTITSFGTVANRYRIVHYTQSGITIAASAATLLGGVARVTPSGGAYQHIASDAGGVWREVYWSAAGEDGPGLVTRATATEAKTGTEATKYITPATMKAAALVHSWGAEAAAVFAYATPAGLTYDRMHQIAVTISKFQYQGHWDKFDFLYFLQAYDSATARINWKEPGTFNATAVNSPTFTKDGGFTGNNSSAYLLTSFQPDTLDNNMQVNNASVGIKIAAQTATGKSVFGATSTLRTNINPTLGGTWTSRFNDSTNVTTPSVVLTGLFSMDRSVSTQYLKMIDGATIDTEVVTATAVTSGFITLLGTVSGSQYSDARATFAFAGASLGTAAAHLAVNTIHSQYATAIGAT